MQMEIGLGKAFSGSSVSGDTRFRDGKRGKNKDCFGNKQFFFESLFSPPGPDPGRIRKTLLDKGFKFPYRSFEGPFFFSIEPPFGSSFFHQGIDVPHPDEIPDAFQLAA